MSLGGVTAVFFQPPATAMLQTNQPETNEKARISQKGIDERWWWWWRYHGGKSIQRGLLLAKVEMPCTSASRLK